MLFTRPFLALLISLLPLTACSLSILSASELVKRNDTSSSNASSITHVTSAPEPPTFKWLYTVFAYCPANLAPDLAGPYGVRKVIPIIGGVIEGPYFNGLLPLFPIPSRSELISLSLLGTLRNLGADWGLVDPQTGVFSADTRYEGVTDKGDELYFQTSGPGQEQGGLHLRIKVETSSRELYWLNEIVGESHLDLRCIQSERWEADECV